MGKRKNRLTLQRHHIVRSLVIILSYFVTGYAGIHLPYFGTSVTLIWPLQGSFWRRLFFGDGGIFQRCISPPFCLTS